MIRALAIVLLLPASALAQNTPLPSGWERTQIQPAPLFQTVALACSDDEAFVREWSGQVRAFDGRAWSALPSVDARGGTLWASPRGRVVLEGESALQAWDGRAWSEIELDPWLARPARGNRVFEIDGLGESPWVLGRSAIGLDPTPGDGEHLHAYDVTNAWYSLDDLEVLAMDRVYVASEAGLLRWDGHAWSIEPTQVDGPLAGVEAFAPDDVWVWGEHGIAHFDGRAWTVRSEGIEIPPRPGRWGQVPIHLGGRADRVYASTPNAVYRWSGDRWARELDETQRAPIGRGYGPICATESFVVIAEGGYALIAR